MGKIIHLNEPPPAKDEPPLGICNQCGRCCYMFPAKGLTKRGDIQGIVRMLNAIGGFPLPVFLTDQTELKLTVNLDNAPCQHYDQISHLCKDYLNRPEICRKHWCEESKQRLRERNGEAEAKGTDGRPD